MYALGYLSGVNASGDFGGEGAMTRAQSCVVMSKLLGTDVETAPETPDEGATGSAPIEEETPAEDAGSEPADTVAAYEQEVFDLVNQIRAENGLEPFVYNVTLAETARAHSQDMIDRNFFSHTNPDGEDPFDRMRDNGPEFLHGCGEHRRRPAHPGGSGEQLDELRGSPGQHPGGCEELGVGLALGGSYGYYWTSALPPCADIKTIRDGPLPAAGGSRFFRGRTHEIQPYAPRRRLPAALALIGLALLGLLFVPECDDCYFVYWSFDSLRDWLLTRPSTAGVEIVGVPENGRYLGNLLGVLQASCTSSPLWVPSSGDC